MQNILVLDDDRDLLEMVRIFLKREGLMVAAIEDHNQLTAQLEASVPDIILMDIYLGKADGRDICLGLKQSDRYSNIPVILYSAGHIPAATVQECKADAFIVKPFELDMLLEKIKVFGGWNTQ